MKRIFKSNRFITETIDITQIETYTDEPSYSVVSVVQYDAPFSATALKVWEKHRCTLQYNNCIEQIVAKWKSNNVTISLLPIHWGSPATGSWGKLRLKFMCYGLLNEAELIRIKALGEQIRKQITILARDLN